MMKIAYYFKLDKIFMYANPKNYKLDLDDFFMSFDSLYVMENLEKFIDIANKKMYCPYLYFSFDKMLISFDYSEIYLGIETKSGFDDTSSEILKTLSLSERLFIH